MKLFTIVNNQPCIEPATLLIPEFKSVWNRDKSKTKSKAIGELAYVYFATDYLSIYLSYTKELRQERLGEDFMDDKSYKPDPLIIEAMKKYEELQQTPTMNFLKAAQYAQQETEKYFRSIDYTERDFKGNPVYKGTEVTKMLKDCAGVKDSLDKLIEAVKKEMTNGSKARGGGVGGEMEFEDN